MLAEKWAARRDLDEWCEICFLRFMIWAVVQKWGSRTHHWFAKDLKVVLGKAIVRWCSHLKGPHLLQKQQSRAQERARSRPGRDTPSSTTSAKLQMGASKWPQPVSLLSRVSCQCGASNLQTDPRQLSLGTNSHNYNTSHQTHMS